MFVTPFAQWMRDRISVLGVLNESNVLACNVDGITSKNHASSIFRIKCWSHPLSLIYPRLHHQIWLHFLWSCTGRTILNTCLLKVSVFRSFVKVSFLCHFLLWNPCDLKWQLRVFVGSSSLLWSYGVVVYFFSCHSFIFTFNLNQLLL